MTDVKVSALPSASVLSGSDVFPVVQGGTTKRATGTQLQTLASAGFSGSAVAYNNATSGLPSTTTQAAIDALAAVNGVALLPSGDPTGVTDQTRIEAIVASGKAVLLTKGTYYLTDLDLNANACILTQGFETVFQQVAGLSVGTRMINIKGSNVVLGSCTVKGNIATDTSEQQHSIFIIGAADITNIRIGDVNGSDIRGDVVYIGGLASAKVSDVSIGAVYGSNILRNVISIAGGKNIKIQSITGGACGYKIFDIEPNSNSQTPEDIEIGYIRGGSAKVEGYQTTVIAKRVRIRQMELDPALQANTTPTYSAYTVASGFQVRNCYDVYVGHFKAKDFNSFCAEVIYNSGTDARPENIVFDSIDWANSSLVDVTYNCYFKAIGARNIEIRGGRHASSGTSKSMILGNSSAPTDLRVNVSNLTTDGTLVSYCGYSTFERIYTNTANSQYLLKNAQYSTVRNSDITHGRYIGFCTQVRTQDTQVTTSVQLMDTTTQAHPIVNSVINSKYHLNSNNAFPDLLFAAGNTSTAPTPNLLSGRVQTWTMNNNCTFAAPSNPPAAAYYGAVELVLLLTQDGTGSRTLAWNAIYKDLPAGLAAGGAAATKATVKFSYDGTNWNWVGGSSVFV